MYPLLARRSHLAVYLLLWMLMGILLAAILALQGGLPWINALVGGLPMAVAYSFICLSAWYVARSMPLAGTGGIRVVVTALAAAAVSAAMWLVVGRGWMALVSSRWPPAQGARTFAAIQTLLFAAGVLLYLLALAISYVLVVYEASQEAQRRGLQGQVLAREAELRSLRAQIDPHFLFNCLHSISALTTVNPQAARRMCLLLGDFLRETLALGGEARITVARELKLAERFLAVERIRFGDRLDVEIATDPTAESGHVPPLLLQPIVENAVTHGIAHMLDGGTIRIAATRTPARLSIVVENPCDPDRPRSKGAGVGLANVRARLRALHGNDAVVSTGEQGGRWRVELSFPAAALTEKESA